VEGSTSSAEGPDSRVPRGICTIPVRRKGELASSSVTAFFAVLLCPFLGVGIAYTGQRRAVFEDLYL